MENNERPVSELDQNHDSCQKLEHFQTLASLARSDSGTGKSVTSQDLGDEDPSLCPCIIDSPNQDNIQQAVESENFTSRSNEGHLHCSNTTGACSVNINFWAVGYSKLDPRSLENFGHMTSRCESSLIPSPARSLQEPEDKCEKNVQTNTDSSTQMLLNSLQPSPSPHKVQLKLSDNSVSSPTTTIAELGNMLRCVPISSPLMPDHLCGFSSFPLSHSGMVSKDVMNQLTKELNQEKWKVEALERVNNQLHMSQAEHEKYILYLMEQFCSWRQKFEVKDQELYTKQQEIEMLRNRCIELERESSCQMKSLNEKIQSEQEITNSLRVTLRAKKASVQQLRKENEKLRKENDWLKEGLENKPSTTMVEEDTHEDSPVGCNGQLNYFSFNGSSETYIKGVYSERAASPYYSTCQVQGAKSEENSRISNGVRDNGNISEKQCSNCFVMCSEFNVYEEFKEHTERCAHSSG